MKKLLSILLFAILAMGFLTITIEATDVGHEHQWSSYVQGADKHWQECLVDGCTEIRNEGAHVHKNYKYLCDVCKNWESHKCYNSNANCLYGGTCEGCGYGAPKNPNKHATKYGNMLNANSHEIICDCGYVYVKSEPHNFESWDDIGNGKEESWCTECLHAVTRTKQSSGSSSSNNGESSSSTTHTHKYSKATCVSPAKCSCGETKGSKDTSNHTGGTVVKGKVEATYEKEGYSGDTYCKGCDAKIKTGKVVAKKVAETTDKKDENTQTTLPENNAVTNNNEVIGNNEITNGNENVNNLETNSNIDSITTAEKNVFTSFVSNNWIWLASSAFVIVVIIGAISIIITKRKKGE